MHTTLALINHIFVTIFTSINFRTNYENADLQYSNIDNNHFILQGNMIEGCLPENNVRRFGDKLKESLVYEISSFMVVNARNSYRVADHAFRIKIGQQTKIKEINLPPESFPFYAYKAESFDTLETQMKKTNILSGT